MDKYFKNAIELETILKKYFSLNISKEEERIINQIKSSLYVREFDKYQSVRTLKDLTFKDNEDNKVCEIYGDFFINKGIVDLTYNLNINFKKLKYHKHNFVEFIYVYKGEYTQYIDGKKYVYKEGEVCVLNTNVFHREESIGENDFIIYLCIGKDFFNINYLNSLKIYSNFVEFLKRQESDKSRDYINFRNKNNGILEEAIKNIAREFYYKDQGYVYIIKGYMQRVLAILLTEYDLEIVFDNSEQVENRIFKEIDFFIKSNLATITREEVGCKFYYNPNHINRIIRKNTGQSYLDYIKNLKLEKAIVMLKQDKYSINEIISSLGYSNKTYFYKIFMDKYRVTPNEYRILNKK